MYILWRVWRETRDCEPSSLLFFAAHELSELAIEYIFSLFNQVFGEEFSSYFVVANS